MPDRYFISTDLEVPLGRRRLAGRFYFIFKNSKLNIFDYDADWKTIFGRMFRFAAYPATQYYILEKKVHHEALEAEGGFGLTYTIEKGPIIFAKLGWR